MRTDILEMLQSSFVEDVEKWIELYKQDKIDLKVVYPGLGEEKPKGYEYLCGVMDGYICWKKI